MQHPTKAIDFLLRDPLGKYTIWSLSNRPYSEDVISHWITRYWSNLESMHLNGPMSGSEYDTDLHCVYLDLASAIEKLPAQERRAIELVCSGLAKYRSVDNITDNVAHKMHMSNGELTRLLGCAYRRMNKELEG